MTDTTPPADRRTPTWVKVLLAVSLALNLLVAGVVVGARFGDGPHGHDGRPGPRGGFDPALGPFSRALPEPYRDRALDELRARAGDARANRAALAGQVSEMLSLLRDEPFDAQAMGAVLDAQSAVFAERGEIGRDVVLEQIAAMSPAERAALADRLERGLRRALEGAGR
jgi:uncharacterized membrane protein